ncbi:hypothetical protein FOZ61_009652 [Perkinsus olseni]|uniref:Uncharacterized protein n=1 Tax=Perkinsus olseni TaxID=32597 RepID=A0A7J6M4S7_PEROL|nr:hypothetical protein FOZ61_009652 [Perkinsus olseni]
MDPVSQPLAIGSLTRTDCYLFRAFFKLEPTMSIAVLHLMAFAVLYLQANAIDKNQAVFPPDEYYCCKKAELKEFLWALRFPRRPEFLKNTMSIFKMVNHQQVYTYGIPIAKNECPQGTSIKVDVESKNFTRFAEEYGLDADQWRSLPYDGRTNTITINPSGGDDEQENLTPGHCKGF